jgi:hypothetical protein
MGVLLSQTEKGVVNDFLVYHCDFPIWKIVIASIGLQAKLTISKVAPLAAANALISASVPGS